MKFLNSRENKILAFLIINAILFVTLFFFDLNKKIDIGNRKIIGTVEFKKNTVQRKLDDHIVWESLDTNSPITNKDTIRSESLSDAIIRLNDGTEINLDENSMFFLDITGEDPTISFDQGSIQIKKKDGSAGDLKIQSNNKTIEIKDGELNIQKGENGNFNVQVEKGNALITSGGKQTNVASGKQADLTGNNLAISNIPFDLISPPNNSIIQSNSDTKTVDFKWKANVQYSKLKFEISKNPNFNSIFKSSEYPKSSFTESLPLGSYYWRLVSDKGKSIPYRFHVFKEEELSLKFPENQTELTYVEKLPLVNFQWNRDQFTKEYILEISESPNFDSLLARQITRSNSFSMDNLNVGKIYWRVKAIPYSTDLPERTSSSRYFTIKKGSNFTEPKIERPINERFLVSAFKEQGILIWSSSSELVKYEVSISKENSFKNILMKKVSLRNFIQPKLNLTKGEYYWRVKGFSASGKESKYSSNGKFTLVDNASDLVDKKEESSSELEDSTLKKNEISQKLLKYPVDTVVDLSGEKSLSFSWNKDSSGFVYILSIYQDENGKKKPIHQIKTKESNYKLKDLTILDEGKFSWEVTVLSGTKQIRKESGKFIIALTKLRNLKPSDIEFISPSVLFREGKK